MTPGQMVECLKKLVVVNAECKNKDNASQGDGAARVEGSREVRSTNRSKEIDRRKAEKDDEVSFVDVRSIDWRLLQVIQIYPSSEGQ